MKRILAGGLLALLSFAVNINAAATNAPTAYDIMPVRGFCIAAPQSKGLEAFIQFVDKELAPRHVNTLILRVDYDYQYESHPELRDEGALSKAEVKKLVAVCRKDGIKIIPQINLLGHQSFRSHLGMLLQKYPKFDETPWVKMPKEYKWPNADNLYCKSYCPLESEVHKVIFPLIDELCDVFETDAFHAGMDEVFYLGEDKCPRCRGRDKAELFADEVRRIHDHLQQKGRTLWIWGDRLIDGRTTGLGEWQASYNCTYRAIDLIPKDVVICDWHYALPVPTAAYFAVKGFRVVTCPWRDNGCAVQQTDDMVKWRATSTPEMKPCFRGMVDTVWWGADKFLAEDYGTDSPTNAWSCFKATFDEIKKLDEAQGVKQ